MKLQTFPVLAVILLCLTSIVLPAQKTMTWTTTSAEAGKVFASGLKHLVNVEFEEAYDDFDNAVKMDPDFTAAQFFKARLSYGESRSKYFAMAQKSAANKTDAEKLLVTLADTSLTRKDRHGIFEKLHNMYPEDAILENFYVMSEPDSTARLALLEEQYQKFPNSPEVHNQMGYYYMTIKKDMPKAKECFDKYIQLYPDGYNPYDSMGEYYLTVGDKENAKKYYTKSLERCPNSFSSQTKYQELTK